MTQENNNIEKLEKSLRFFEPGESGTVKHVLGQGPIKRRLFDMGVTPGVEIVMKKFAPLGDPMEVSLRGYELSLRKSEAEHIVMSVDNQMMSRGNRFRNQGQLAHRGRVFSDKIQIEKGKTPLEDDLYCSVNFGGRGPRRRGRRRGRS